MTNFELQALLFIHRSPRTGRTNNFCLAFDWSSFSVRRWETPRHTETLPVEDAVEKAVITSEMIAAGGEDLDEVRQARMRWAGRVKRSRVGSLF